MEQRMTSRMMGEVLTWEAAGTGEDEGGREQWVGTLLPQLGQF
jgi:hypothetical protein